MARVNTSKMETMEGKYDDMKDWVLDPNGYFLIRVNREEKRIEAGFCEKANRILFMVHGKRASDVYFTISKKGLISRLDHAAYLGKELYKAELALKYNLKYVQDEDIVISTP